jgi:60 kDa SS-A/Ro ribonucleoprotein
MNHCGGPCTFINRQERFQRFLILGSESSYYCPSATLKGETIECINELCEQELGADIMILTILKLDKERRVPKHSHILFAMAAMCNHSEEMRRRVYEELLIPCCRTISHLFEFFSYINHISWGRHAKKWLNQWLTRFTPREFAYQVTKYRNRKGFKPADLLRLLHPVETGSRNNVYKYCLDQWEFDEDDLELSTYLANVDIARYSTLLEDVIPAVLKHQLTWEHIGQQQLLKEPSLWEIFLISHMPFQAVLKNICRMLECGVRQDYIIHYLTNTELMEKTKMHPIQFLLALHMVAHSPDLAKENHRLVMHLERCFTDAFQFVTPSQARLLVGVDVSASMDGSTCVGARSLTAREAACAFAMVLKRTEPYVKIMAFSDTLVPFQITEEDRLTNIIEKARQIPFGGTDCSLPIQYAIENKLIVDAFVVITDNETNYGRVHPKVLLERYRSSINPMAKMVVLSTASTNVSIADPTTNYMLDIAGFDASVFDVMRDFLTS